MCLCGSIFSVWQLLVPASAPTVVGALRPRNGPFSLGVTQQVQLQKQTLQLQQQQPQTLQLQQQQQQPWSQGEKVPPQPQRPQKPEPTS